jgi:hypothetical protein
MDNVLVADAVAVAAAVEVEVVSKPLHRRSVLPPVRG